MHCSDTLLIASIWWRRVSWLRVHFGSLTCRLTSCHKRAQPAPETHYTCQTKLYQWIAERSRSTRYRWRRWSAIDRNCIPIETADDETDYWFQHSVLLSMWAQHLNRNGGNHAAHATKSRICVCLPYDESSPHPCHSSSPRSWTPRPIINKRRREA